MFASLRHGTVGRGDNQNRSIHLRRAGNHVLDVIGVTGAIDVGVVPIRGFILTCATAIVMPRAFSSGSVIDRIETPELVFRIVLGQRLGNRRREGNLAVVDD